MLNAERCELLDDARLRSQVLGLERRTSRAGRDSVDHGPSGSDDRINSAAGALVLAAQMVGSDAIPVVRQRGGGALTQRAGRINWTQAP